MCRLKLKLICFSTRSCNCNFRNVVVVEGNVELNALIRVGALTGPDASHANVYCHLSNTYCNNSPT